MKADTNTTMFRISGIEAVAMGQYGVKGTYPIHFHMLFKIDPANFWAKNNSVHHNFQRCYVVHGTNGVTVAHNVAYDTCGHCYFMEDGYEQDTTFYRNLGLGTRTGIMPYTIPSDANPATFWITSPLNTLTSNHAAGSAANGIWYIFANGLTGLSATWDYIPVPHWNYGQAFKTPIYPADNNVAHSNAHTGFMLGQLLTVDQNDVFPAPECDLSPTTWAPDGTHQISGLTVFKNIKENIWNTCNETTWTDLKAERAGVVSDTMNFYAGLWLPAM
jgi:cell migration-inducing and hyaluronan-binding protein